MPLLFGLFLIIVLLASDTRAQTPHSGQLEDLKQLSIEELADTVSQISGPQYSELDARIGYRIRPGWDLSLIGTSLIHDRHLEFRAGTAPETYERAVALRSVWRW